MARTASVQANGSVRLRETDTSAAHQSLSDHALLLAAPAHRKLVALEPILKRSIPFLLVTFVVLIGLLRVHALLTERTTTLTDARARVALSATAVAAIAAGPVATGGEALAGEMQGHLKAAFPSETVLNGARIAITRADGTIIAALPNVPTWTGRQLADIVGANQPLAIMGAQAGVQDIQLPNGTSALAAVAHLDAPLGAALVVMGEDAIMSEWRQHVRSNALVFAITALILGIMTYAYFNQISRADAADAVNRDTRTRTDAALRRARCGLWDWDLDQSRMYWSPSMFEMLGLSADRCLISAEDAAGHIVEGDLDLAAVAPLLASDQLSALDTDIRMRRADGETLWFRIRGEVAVRPETGRRHLIGIAADITEARLKSEADALADVRLRDAIETISEAFVLWDSNNHLVICNSKYQQLHNLPDGLVSAGAAYAKVMEQARQPVICTEIPQESRDAADSVTYEAQIEDGRWLQINERRTKDGGFVSVGTDITQLKRHEERLTESEKRLIGTVMDLRHSRQELELQAQQLVELAQKYSEEKLRAEEANKIKSDFLANISHELRTPLNAIIGFSEIMSDGVVGVMGPEKYAEYGRDIHASGKFLLNVINDILDMSKIEAGRMELRPEALNFSDVASETIRVIEPLAGEKSIAVAEEIEPGLVLAADRRALKQILMNLMSNAVKFTPSGGRIAVKARSMPDAVTISIEDTGIGIPAEEIRRLGQPFVQVANQFTKTHKGSGLGLAIARSLVDLHGGTMKIWSTEGVGTIVSIRLPWHRPAGGGESAVA